MMPQPLVIHVISDGKPGHQNQSLGLTDAIGRITPVIVEKIAVGETRGLFPRMGAALEGQRKLHPPDLVIGAGHATHPSLILLSKKLDAPSVVLMKPSLPWVLFDLCLVPQHDLRGGGTPYGVVTTIGALNRVPPPDASISKVRKVILIGGPSSSHGWSGADVLEMIGTIAVKDGWEITDSRRTPEGTLEQVARKCPGAQIHPHAGTGPGWLPSTLAAAEQVWVTEDSVSMIYEALSSGARVGLLPVPVRKSRSRVVLGLRKLIDEGYVTRFADWTPGTPLPPPPVILREADRCARIVLARLFPHLLTALP